MRDAGVLHKRGKCIATLFHLKALLKHADSLLHGQSATLTQGKIYYTGNPGGTGCCHPKAVQNNLNLFTVDNSKDAFQLFHYEGDLQ